MNCSHDNGSDSDGKTAHDNPKETRVRDSGATPSSAYRQTSSEGLCGISVRSPKPAIQNRIGRESPGFDGNSGVYRQRGKLKASNMFPRATKAGAAWHSSRQSTSEGSTNITERSIDKKLSNIVCSSSFLGSVDANKQFRSAVDTRHHSHDYNVDVDGEILLQLDELDLSSNGSNFDVTGDNAQDNERGIDVAEIAKIKWAESQRNRTHPHSGTAPVCEGRANSDKDNEALDRNDEINRILDMVDVAEVDDIDTQQSNSETPSLPSTGKMPSQTSPRYATARRLEARIGAFATPGINDSAGQSMSINHDFSDNEETATATTTTPATQAALSASDSLQLPVVADLAPDTDALVQQAILNERRRQENEQPILVDSQPVDEDRQRAKMRKVQMGMAAACLLVTVVVIIAVALAVALSGNSSLSTSSNAMLTNTTVSPTLSPTVSTHPLPLPSAHPSPPPSAQSSMMPSTQPTLSDFGQQAYKITELTGGDLSVFYDTNSAQSHAAQWLLDDMRVRLGENVSVAEAWTNETMELELERYAGAVLYYATNGDEWADQFNFLSHDDICSWSALTAVEVIAPDGLAAIFPTLGGFLCHQVTSALFLILPEINLRGTIPTEIGLLRSINTLSITRNFQLSGTIPTEVGSLSNLEYLDLGYNKLTGTFPSEIRRLNNLRGLGLEYTKFDGNVTFEEGDFPVLASLKLADTLWESRLPNSIGYLTSLTSLTMARTRMTGTIPTELGLLTQLMYLALSGCWIQGTLPTELGYLTALREIDMDKSISLSGPIPTELGSLSELTSLRVACTKINGTIPDQLWELTNLELVDVSGSMVSGDVPLEFCHSESDSSQRLGSCDIQFQAAAPIECTRLISNGVITDKVFCCSCPLTDDTVVGSNARGCDWFDDCRRDFT